MSDIAGLPEGCQAQAAGVDLADRLALDIPCAVVAKALTKRAFDLVVAAALLLVFLPLLAVIAIAIRLETGAPILFRQRRTGLGGRVFTIYKFRTMTVAEDCAQVRQASRDDARVTAVGAVLRRLSLDELPQLLNILSGDMSLVGPRPHALAHDTRFAGLSPAYRARFRARPGLTGLAQVEGYRGEICDLGALEGRVAADNAYIDDWSMGRDLAILARTLPLIFRDPRAY